MPPPKSSPKFKSILRGYAKALDNLDKEEKRPSSRRFSSPNRRAVRPKRIQWSIRRPIKATTAPDPPNASLAVDDDKTVKISNRSTDKYVEKDVETVCALLKNSLDSQQSAGEIVTENQQESTVKSTKSLPTEPLSLEKENCLSQYVDQSSSEVVPDIAPPSPKRRRTNDKVPDANSLHNLPFGYFTGHQLYRNQLNRWELLENGHVSLRNLILPDCELALITTFEIPALDWMERELAQIPQVILVAHSFPRVSLSGEDDTVKDKNGSLLPEEQEAPVIGQSRAQQPIPNRPDWYWIAVRPHVGLMHAKLFLFRCERGLRIVVSGNNFTQHQMSRDRDCMYVQDLPVDTTGRIACDVDTELSRLKSFLTELTSSPHHAELMEEKLGQLFHQISSKELEANVRFVHSFPRESVSNGTTRGDRGGWQQLAHIVSCFRKEAGHSSCYRTFDKQKRLLEEMHLYAMSGALGDLKPDFLLQMRHTMSGNLIVPTTAEWADIGRTYILWPSAETARTMHPLSMLGSGRAMGQEHWKSIPFESRQRIFFDALPSPSFKAHDKYHAFAHCKVILAEQENAWGAMYVGSHNFSRKAWGLKNGMPGNVEFGVVLFTEDSCVLDAWRSRLPYKLPAKDSTAPSDYDIGRGDPSWLKNFFPDSGSS